MPSLGSSPETSLRSFASGIATIGLVMLLLLAGVGDAQAQATGQFDCDAVQQITSKAEGGDAEAQTALAFMHGNGECVAQDYGAAVAWFRRAVAQEFVTAQYGLGIAYHNGLGVGVDYGEAARLYALAAHQGFAPAQYNLGFMHARGEGVERDLVVALAWIHIAAEQGHEDAQFARNRLGAVLTPDQIAAAQTQVKSLIDAIYDSP